MGSIFGKKKKKSNKLSATDAALLQVKQCRDKIKEYIKSCEKNAALKKEKAKEFLKNNQKDRAKIFLKQSKMYELQVQNGDNQLSMIEDQITQIETTQMQSEAMKALEQGNSALKQLQKECNVEKWEKISDEMAEMKESQDEIAQFFLDRGISAEEEEKSVEDELNKLMGEVGEEAKQDLNFPKANNEEIVQENKEQDEVKEENKKEMMEA